MRLLYSNILPAGLEDGQTTILDCFNEQIGNCDGLDIAVGYVSKAALEELNRYSIANQCRIPRSSVQCYGNNI